MATVAKWEFARNTGHADLKPPKKGTPITMRPHECAMFGEHTFSDEDEGDDNIFRLIIPAMTAMKKGIAVHVVNPASAQDRDSIRLYSTLYVNPPHFEVSGYGADEWAIWHEETNAKNISTGGNAAGGFGKIYYPITSGGLAESYAEQPRANLMLFGGGMNGILVAYFAR